MDKIFSYNAPGFQPDDSKFNDDHWDAAVDHFKNERFKETVDSLIDYIDPALRPKHASGNGYRIPHGSIVVNIKFEEDKLIIDSPFLNLEDSKRVPLMRRLAEIKQHPLNLASLKIADNEAHFHYTCTMHTCEPYKVYNVLREICHLADMYDDEFIEKFDAKHLTEPEVQHLDDHKKGETVASINSIIKEGLEYYDYYQSKRWGNLAWYALNITLKRIDVFAQPQGYFRTELERAIQTLYDRNQSFADALMKTKQHLQKFADYDETSLKNSLYKINTFVPSKYKGNIENIKENWKGAYDDVRQMIGGGNYEEASLLILSSFYNLLHHNYVDANTQSAISSAMTNAAGKSWGEGGEILWKTMQNIMEGNLEEAGHGMDLSKAMEENMSKGMEMVQKMFGMFK